MNIPIEDLLPSDVLDEIVVSDQSHVLGYFEENDFTEEDVANFVKQCRSFDMLRSCNLYTNSMSRNKILTRMYNDIKEYPSNYMHLESLCDEDKQKYTNRGIQLLADGKLALILLAGGQASRLSPEMIKGDYDIGLPSHKSLFHRIVQSIRRVEIMVQERLNQEIHIPLYIMTSEFNNQAIIDHILFHDDI